MGAQELLECSRDLNDLVVVLSQEVTDLNGLMGIIWCWIIFEDKFLVSVLYSQMIASAKCSFHKIMVLSFVIGLQVF